MTGSETLWPMVVYKSSAILGIVMAISLLSGRRWPAGCTAWNRAGIAGLLILPFSVAFLPMISIPLLPAPSSQTMKNRDSVTVTREPRQTLPTEISEEAQEFDPLMKEDQKNAADATLVERGPRAVPVRQPISVWRILISCLFWIYVGIASILLIRLVSSWRGLNRLRQMGAPISDPEIVWYLAKWTKLLNLRRSIALRVSDEVTVPMTFGWRSPVILVPSGCLTNGDRIQHEAILLHELRHIATADYLWQILTGFMTSLYWVHPFVWLVRRDTEILRERLCDRFCSQHLGREPYSQALLQIAAGSSPLPSGGLGMAMAQRSSLYRRLNDLAACHAEPHSRSSRTQQTLVVGMAATVLGLVILGMLTVRVPTSKQLQSEESPKPVEVLESAAEWTTFNWTGDNSEVPAGRHGATNPPFAPLDASSEMIEWEDDTEAFNSEVAATVNGFPILNGQVFDRYGGYLISVREQMQAHANDPKKRPPGQPVPTIEGFRKFRESLIQRDIATYIQKVALVQYLKADLSPDQLVQTELHIDKLFQKEIERLNRDLGVTTIEELEQALKAKGTTLKKVRDNFALDRLSVECLVANSDPPTPIEASEIQVYYESHGDSFDVPGTAKWQKFSVSLSRGLSDTDARSKLELLLSDFNQAGPSGFESMVQKYSDDLDIGKKFYERTEAKSFHDVEFDGRLFTMPLNQWSEIIKSSGTLCVIRVTERQEGRRKTIDEVQDQIQQTLHEEQNANRPKKFLKKLFSMIKIETRFLLPKFVPDEPGPVYEAE